MSLTLRQRRQAQPYTARLDDAQRIAARNDRRHRRERRAARFRFAVLRLKASLARHHRALITHASVALGSALLTLLVTAQPVLDAAERAAQPATSATPGPHSKRVVAP